MSILPWLYNMKIRGGCSGLTLFSKKEIVKFRRAVVKFSMQCSDFFHNEVTILNIMKVKL